MKDVFISYKTEEFNEALWVKDTLETNGLSCWMAPMSIPGGSSYAVEIPQAIRGSKVFVLLLSKKCQESKWVPRELDQAINEGKTVLPFMLENCPLKDEFNFYLTNVQRYEAYKSKAKAIERMVVEIKAIIEAHSCDNEKPFEIYEGTQRTTTDKPVVEEKKPVGNLRKTKHKPATKSVNQVNSKQALKKKKSSAPIIIAIAFVLAISLMIATIVALVLANRVEISGETFKKGIYSVTLAEKCVTQEDIDKLSELKKLSNISFTNCEITAEDLSFIDENISSLTIDNCGLTNEQLNTIDFEKCELYSLKLDNNKNLSDLSNVEYLADTLRILSINNCNVENLNFMYKINTLNEFYADDNSIDDITPISDCTSLTKISLNNNKLTTTIAFEKLINLTHIYLADNSLTDINGLKNTTLLTEVDFSGNILTDIDVLKKSAENLSVVKISGCGLTNINALDDGKSVTTLIADNNKIADISVLKNHIRLKKVVLFNNKIEDISVLENLKSLSYIDLRENYLNKATFDLLDDYIYIDLSDNDIEDLTIPAKTYNFLDLRGNKITDYQSVYKCTGGRVVLEYNKDILFEELSKSQFNSIYIIDCPLDKQVEISSVLGDYRTEYITVDDITAIKEGI